ncbi:ion transporter [Blastopirellula marina]|uniref:Ion transporter n=1 Tax=Blastopirellula marina TaxID=124 RepID=A0A2S8G931_9BACT|nr:ion transporter [Blastopirellula marina]PQO40972.1 ion transporter [Blastopirellula marina]PTL45855.1 ion transporter [Blastopirellula marina]
MPTLKQIIEESDTPAGRIFDLSILTLIVLSLASFSLETMPNLSESGRRWLERFETLSVVVFSLEYLLRIYVASPKRNYVFSFFGLVDLLAILPFFVGLQFDLRSVRALRLLRLFRILKLARYSAAARRFHRALIIAKEEIILFLGAALIILYLAAVGIYQFESEAQPEAFGSVFHCLWWAVATLTTVGYGDVYPITFGGRIFTFVILVIGLGVISVPAGLVASALAQARKMEDEQKEDENE